MSDLTAKEQRHVALALRVLRRRLGAWAPLAKALHFKYDTIEKAANGRRPVSTLMAFRVGRLVDVPLDDLLAGRFVPGDHCKHCGMPINEFEEEETRPE